ncbi:MAG: hypothetical protein ACE5ER_03570 [Nitrospinaceae bacterium]
MENTLIIFVHLMAAAVAIGASVHSLLLLAPQVRQREKDSVLDENSVSYLLLDRLAPTVFVAFLVLVGSGIYFMMENYTDQVNLPDGYYTILGIKLIFVVAAFFCSAYQMFMLKPEIANLDLQPEKRGQVPATLQKMATVGKAALAALSLALFMGIYLARYG